MTVWTLGEVLNPILWGPLSEVYGRRLIGNLTNFLFTAFCAGTALSTNINMLVAFRFLTGASAAQVVLSPGIAGDLFPVEQRGRAMSVLSFAGLAGPVIGPIIGSYLGQAAGWRWIFWLLTILYGAVSLTFLLLYRETYKVQILKRKVSERRRATGNPSLRSKYDTGESLSTRLQKALIRPLRFLITSPMLLLLTAYISLISGYTYLVIAEIAPVFQEYYKFSEGASGLTYLGLCAGLVVGTLFCGAVLDRWVKRASRGAADVTPEMRLPPLAMAALFMPAGLFWFGWTAEAHVQWMAPIVGTAIIGFSYLASSIATRSYIIDAFGIHSVSAYAASLVPRNTASAFLPLAAPALYAELGLGWGNSVLAFIALAFVPIPLLFLRFGKKLRKVGSFRAIE